MSASPSGPAGSARRGCPGRRTTAPAGSGAGRPTVDDDPPTAEPHYAHLPYDPRPPHLRPPPPRRDGAPRPVARRLEVVDRAGGVGDGGPLVAGEPGTGAERRRRHHPRRLQ